MVENNLKIANTKINISTYKIFNTVVKQRGITFYRFMQVVIDNFVKCLSPEFVLDENTKKILKTFANLKFVKGGFTLSDPYQVGVTCNKCIMLLEKNKRQYEEAILIRNPDKGENDIICSRNEDDILKALLHSVAPEAINELEKIKKENELFSLVQALKFAIDEVSGNTISIEEEIRELFSDNERSDFGKKIEYDEFGKYKRKLRRQIG